MSDPDAAFRGAVAAITAEDSYERAVERSAENVADVLRAVCVISLLSGDEKTLYPIGLHGPDPVVLKALEPILGAPLPSDRGFAGRALLEGQPVFVESATPEDLSKIGSPYVRASRGDRSVSALGIPLQTPRRVLGAVTCVSDVDGRRFSEEEVAFVSDVAAVLALRVDADLRTEVAPATTVEEPSGAGASGELLTSREREVLGLIAIGYMNKEIAARLFLSVRTVEWHRARILWKLGLHSRAELVQVANELGLTGKAE